VNGVLNEEINIEQSDGFKVPRYEMHVCKLVKSLCALKTNTKNMVWKIDNVMISNRFHINEYDKCV